MKRVDALFQATPGLAEGDITALAALGTAELGKLRRLAEIWIGPAVDGCRLRGFSDAEIGAALGTTRQAVGQRFGRKGPFTPDSREFTA